ncbi:hypothetical protein O181_090739 [Austropuccinia psidii MF-1]|uniref:Uncharacterized protein n=1 Tax=Austropuccinia psidii MF-1 TaxID=1389203 RepID=A0A9Q3IW05_9BASI|nr:hypothetical protein [Austropuccinia psidii MF-1]
MPPTLPSSLPLTIFTLTSFLQCRPHTGLILNSAYHPYTPAAPSQCDSNVALTTHYASTPPPLTILTLPRHPQVKAPNPETYLCAHTSLSLFFSATYHPYASVLDP